MKELALRYSRQGGDLWHGTLIVKREIVLEERVDGIFTFILRLL